MSEPGEHSVGLCLADLPPDVLLSIFARCQAPALGALACVCRTFNVLISHDSLWLASSKLALATNQTSEVIKQRSIRLLTARDKCRISHNWRRAVCRQDALITLQTRYMPWLDLSSESLWYSKGRVIQCFSRRPDGFLKRSLRYQLKGHFDDVCRFVRRDGLIVSGGRDGSVCGWYEETGRFVFSKRRCHGSDVNSVDFNNNVILSGSRDKTVQVWSLQNQILLPKLVVNVQDRVWSVAINPNNNTFAVGTAGYHPVLPLQLFDLQTGLQLKVLGEKLRIGAGLLHVSYESPFILLSGGYDTFIRLWDTRTATCVSKWEDPYDSVVYSLSTDQCFTIISGTSLHGLVRLWDKRCTKSVQMYYVGHGNSPVYSVTFDASFLYVALDHSLNLLDFSGRNLPNFNRVL